MDYSGYSRPLPEMLDGEDWEVRNSGKLEVAYIDFKKKEFVVPFQGGPSGELVRAHEAMHVKITPKTWKNKLASEDQVTYQAVEDARVNQGLRLAGIPTDKGRVFESKSINKRLSPPEAQTPLRLGEAYFSFKGLAEEKDIRDFIVSQREEVLPICDEIYEEFFGSREKSNKLSTEDDVDKAIKKLKQEMEKISTESELTLDRSSRSHKNRENATYSYYPGKVDADEAMDLPIVTEEESRDIKDALPYSMEYDWEGHSGHRGPPGKMEVVTARFDKILKFKKVKGVKTTPSDEGVIPSNMHRFTTDQKVFTRKGRRRTSAAVLIDVSGSMSLSHEQIEEIVRLCPSAIIATYSAQHNKGNVRIIAHKNRYSTTFRSHSMGGSNVIDYPALQWLAAQKEKKKLWISDGGVTGIGDGPLEAIYLRKIVSLVKQHKIERVGNVKELIKKGVLIDRAFDDGFAIGERIKARIVDAK